jgi:copper chaperone NosL
LKTKAARFLLFLILFLFGCSAQTPTVDSPPEIYYGEDVCIQCNMIISEARFAAGYRTPNGEARIFDDIGGMLKFDREVQEEIYQAWVHDFSSEEWIHADQAYYVVGDEIYSPMAFGMVAFLDLEAAELFAEEKQGDVLSFEELKKYSISGETPAEHAHMEEQSSSIDEKE